MTHAECLTLMLDSSISEMQYFPATDSAARALAEQLLAICVESERVRWLLAHIHTNLDEIPGAATMRELVSQKFAPLQKNADCARSGACGACVDGWRIVYFRNGRRIAEGEYLYGKGPGDSSGAERCRCAG